MKERPSWFRGIIEGKGATERKEKEELLLLSEALSIALEQAPIGFKERTDGELVSQYRTNILSWNDEQIMYYLRHEGLFEDVDFARALIEVASGKCTSVIEQKGA